MKLDLWTISPEATIINALEAIEKVPARDRIIFVVDHKNGLVGTLTDGDIRRALLKGSSLHDPVKDVMRSDFYYLEKEKHDIVKFDHIREKGINLVPIVDADHQIDRLINLSKVRSLLPLHAVLMAGGEGKRLHPLTKKHPKPLLRIGGKPIIEYGVELLIRYGIKKITVAIRYLGDQIRGFLGNGDRYGCDIEYVEEEDALGTMGALEMIDQFAEDHILVMNSDIVTTIDLEAFFTNYMYENALMGVATVPYEVKIPYAVLEIDESEISGLKEKPTYTYYSNGGIYLLQRGCIKQIPKREEFNATDMMKILISQGCKIISYPVRNYWLDIGRHEDFVKAQEDIHHIKFE